jgi:RNA-directed DNA polymerase
MNGTTEDYPPQSSQGVDERERLASEVAAPVRDRWPWVEPSAWTERMLTALEEGVKGGKWYCLMDKVLKPPNLLASFAKVEARGGAAGSDHVTVKAFARRLGENIDRLAGQLRDGSYRPAPVRRVHIPKPGSREKRPLGIPTVRDRVVQGALRHVLEPIFERDFAPHSYGFRPRRSCKAALRRVQRLLDDGHMWVVDADIKSYFDAIPHDRLLALVREKVTDRSVLGLVELFLKQGVLEGLREWTPETGTPQGAVISPLLANIYLDPLDHEMAEWGFEMVRYADDFVVMCRDETGAREALGRLRTWTEAHGLCLHPKKTRLVDAAERGGFDFLGYHFERGYKWPRKKSLKKLKDTIRGKTKRCNGHSLERIIDLVNPTLRGWFGYFKHSHKNTFSSLDGWVRMRLRSILRKRRKGKGRGRGSDHQRWPNAYFAEHGLYSLSMAHEEACRSARR